MSILERYLKKENEDNFCTQLYKGMITEKDTISPSYINLANPKFIEINGIYYSSLLVVNYNREHSDLLLKDIINTNININISMFYEKEDVYKVIRELTYHIGNVGLEVRTLAKDRQDADIAAFTYNDAKYIRKEIQVNNEDLYYLYMYMNLFSNNKKELEYSINQIEGLCQAKGIITKRAYFRQEDAFIACSPSMQNSNLLKEVSRRNVLTSGLVGTYPFISSSIFDENGIFIGTSIYNNSLIFIDRYNTNKYKNANMCIFGTSGAGKSYYTKLMILRYRLFGIYQYIIDPDREYDKLCKELNGTIIKLGPSSNTYINIFDIREDSIEENNIGFLATKITKLIAFFNLIFGEMNEEEKGIIEEKIIEVYKQKGITFDDETLYKNDKNKINIKPIFKETKDMPILEDFYNILDKNENTKKFKIKLIPFVKGSLRFFNNYTNIQLENKLIIADVYELGEENLQYGMFLFTELFWDKIKKDRNIKKAVYLDEIWRLIGVTSNKNVASFVYKIFKTIRKYGGSAVAITQDVVDLFSLDNGSYGKSILNNSSNKVFFSLEEENIKTLEVYSNLSSKEKIEIKSLKRGECLLFAGDDHILTKVESSDIEKRIVGGDVNEKNCNSIGKSNFK
ncbi:MAG: ATP-binding protein [Clostridia bacterium]|nr:ATP-binding protein [Clostridia bacterium]